MGFFNKLVLVFPCTFWDLHIDTFGSVNSPRASPEEEDSYDPDAYASVRGRHYLFWNLHHTTNLPILVSFISGDAALKYVDTKDSEIVSDAMSVLRKIFETDENHVPDPVKTIVTRWGEDPFAFGSYSSIGLGSTGKNYDQLGRSLGQKVFWAGEATCREYPATVHGISLFYSF